MLVQSHRDALDLLPALPAAWPSGSVRGLRARDGFELDLEWRDGQVTAVAVRSLLGRTLKLRTGDRAIERATAVGGTYRFNRQLAAVGN